MTEREAFLKAICDSPDDDTPRLVFADWLTEHGDEPRAEFIRLGIRDGHREYFAAHADACECGGCRDRRAMTALLAVHHRHWTNWSLWDNQWPRHDLGQNWAWRRGFVHSVTCSGDDWARHGDAVLREHPVREVTLTELVVDRSGREAQILWPDLLAARWPRIPPEGWKYALPQERIRGAVTDENGNWHIARRTEDGQVVIDTFRDPYTRE